MIDKDLFYLNKQEPNQGCLLTLRNIILSLNNDITETTKYGMPCFSYLNRAICYLWVEKESNHPYILFVNGNKLDYPELEQGKRSRMKIMKFDPYKDLPKDTIMMILRDALEIGR